ncbi:hypothetical protein Tel_03690 [Candidatus Tenderia electrophaga]|mgnify:CR=1 FL=1|jgi:osmotically-inducible protein OsmY|uniref:BON domain-containing protein n=1 Tax=Candidatus Tenderia electrophaga TaxID=1748243 RepID=A0A0S2TB29_9GAMM|nr:hypothetical protein Tel_03690 [Candidatus Tenderia electrophaga]
MPALRLTLALVSLISLYGCAAGPAIIAGGAVVGAAAVDRRATTTMVDDNSIELKIKEAIYTDDSLKRDVNVSVTSYNRVVLLTGEVPTAEMRARVVRHAQHVDKVKKIYNETIVAPQSEFASRRLDTWITTKVKSTLLNTEGIKALNIKVVTENQIVYLMGLVTRAEGDIAANKARQVKDIKQIVKLFEYIQPSAT